MIGYFDGQPDWSRVDATEDLLIHLLAYAPGDTRAPVFCFLGWLNWYKGLSVVYEKDGTEDHWSGLRPDKINEVIELEQTH